MSGDIRDRSLATEVASRTVLAGGFRTLVKYDVSYVDTAGGTRHQDRELLEGGRVVAAIGYDPKTRRLVLIRQYRLAAELANGAGQMIEIVAGGKEEGETTLEAARREFVEETTLEPIALRYVYTTMPTPGLTTEIAEVFIALVDASGLPERAGEDEDEDIEPFTATLDEALDAADRGAIVNSFTLLALNWFARRGEEIVRAMLEEEAPS
ncbi:MAG: NUDIX hydrolase [Brucellaceae bacterium]|nr:NUDIX hydrolase [Brucellaceae bacterium]